MQRLDFLPAWFDHATSMSDPDDGIVLAHTGVMVDGDAFYFTGATEEFLMALKIPKRIEFALDMETFTGRVRLSFERNAEDGKNAAGQWRALYTLMEIEAFAHLWNSSTDSVHGIPSDKICLHLKAADTAYPVILGNGHHGDLIFRDGRFSGQFIDPETVPEAN